MDFIEIDIIDIVDILIVAFIMWQIFRLLKGTAAMAIVLGIAALYIIWVIVDAANMELMGRIMSQVIGVGALALVVVFQQEIRHYLLMLGTRMTQTSNRFLKFILGSQTVIVNRGIISDIVTAAMDMSSGKVGALIVFERGSDLQTIKDTGDLINADISTRLIETIFFKNTPLHDGAMIITGNRISYARCVLPVSDNLSIPAKLGLRHRAAVGITEQTDAFALVVSEQTGGISIIDNGEINTLKAGDNLSEILSEKFSKARSKTTQGSLQQE